MTNTSKTVIFFGNERLATGVSTVAPTLSTLLSAGYNVAAVVSHNEAATSRKQRALEISEIAENHNIPVLLPNNPATIIEQLKSYKADIGVLVAYGKIIPQSVIDIFPHGIINVHPSLLPLHRGSIPIESVLLEGAEETGVSIMKLVKEMDAGPVYAQTKFNLQSSPVISKQKLADTLLNIGADLTIKHLPKILAGFETPVQQDETLATYDNLITKDDGIINWQLSASEIERQVRAYLNWPKSKTTLGDKSVTVTSVSVLDLDGEPGDTLVQNGELVVFCKQGAIRIERLIPAGKSEMTASAFLLGNKI
jgi:methionyl-tRNA formyltransferase